MRSKWQRRGRLKDGVQLIPHFWPSTQYDSSLILQIAHCQYVQKQAGNRCSSRGWLSKTIRVSSEGHFFIIALSLLLCETTSLLWIHTVLEAFESDASKHSIGLTKV